MECCITLDLRKIKCCGGTGIRTKGLSFNVLRLYHWTTESSVNDPSVRQCNDWQQLSVYAKTFPCPQVIATDSCQQRSIFLSSSSSSVCYSSSSCSYLSSSSSISVEPSIRNAISSNHLQEYTSVASPISLLTITITNILL